MKTATPATSTGTRRPRQEHLPTNGDKKEAAGLADEMLPDDDRRPRQQQQEPRFVPLPRLWAMYLLLCLYRMANALMIRTQFDPDEYWQTLEPAYCLAFASSSSPTREDGNCAYTWEWTRRWDDEGDLDHMDPTTRLRWLSKLLRGPVRSYVPVLPTAGLYLFLRRFGLDANFAVRRGPALLHAALVAAPVDLATFVVCRRALPSRPFAAWWALACSVSSWFHGYALVRTYANSIESALFAAGIVLVGDGLFGGDDDSRSSRRRGGGSDGFVGCKEAVAFFLGGVAASVRFTALAGWVPLGLILARRNRGTLLDKLRYVVHPCATCGTLGIVACCLVDRIMYGFWCAPFLGSLHFNVMLGRGSLYGTHPWHWYVTAGLPAICGIMTPLLAYRMARAARRTIVTRHRPSHGEGRDAEDIEEETTDSRNRRALLLLVSCYVGLHSFSEHKEFRFLLPVLPLVCVLAGDAVDELLDLHIGRPGDANGRHAVAKEEEVMGDDVDGPASSSFKRRRLVKTGIPGGSERSTSAVVVAVGLVLFVFNVPHWAFLALVHQRGPIALNELISRMMIDGEEARRLRQRQGDVDGTTDGAGYSVHYLMGCHSAPVFSHLHVPGVAVDVWSLDCSPACRAATAAAAAAARSTSSSSSASGGDATEVFCESDRFLHDPAAFVASNYRLATGMAKTGGGGVGEDSKGGEGVSSDAATTGFCGANNGRAFSDVDCGDSNGEDSRPTADHRRIIDYGNATRADAAGVCRCPGCADTGLGPTASPVLRRRDPPDFLAAFENEVGHIEGLLVDRMGMERVADIRHSVSWVRWRRPAFDDVANSVVRVLRRTSWGAGVLTSIGLETSTAGRAGGEEGCSAIRTWIPLDVGYEHVVLFAKRGIAKP